MSSAAGETNAFAFSFGDGTGVETLVSLGVALEGNAAGISVFGYADTRFSSFLRLMASSCAAISARSFSASTSAAVCFALTSAMSCCCPTEGSRVGDTEGTFSSRSLCVFVKGETHGLGTAVTGTGGGDFCLYET